MLGRYYFFVSGLTGKRILEIYRQSVVKVPAPTFPITFNRSKNKMKELVRIYKMAASKLDRPPIVYFVSEGGNDEDDLIEEDAADVGGPLREFFYIAIETLMSCTNPHMFEGIMATKYQFILSNWSYEVCLRWLDKPWPMQFCMGNSTLLD